jgi:hypothetical protein
MTLIYAAFLAPGRRVVCTVLRVHGMGDENNCGKYHRLFNRDRWSPMVMSLLWRLVAFHTEVHRHRLSKCVQQTGIVSVIWAKVR